MPSPMRILNTGPAKDAVMAMADNPFLATVMLAIISCEELPQARMVIPMIVLGICKMIPKKLKMLTNLSAIRSNQAAETAKPMIVIGTC